MQFTGTTLRAVENAISLALAEIHNQIATCPDVFNPDWADHLELLEQQKKYYRNLQKRIRHAIKCEKQKAATQTKHRAARKKLDTEPFLTLAREILHPKQHA